MISYLPLVLLLVGIAFAQSNYPYHVNVSAVDVRRLNTSFNGVNPLDPDGPSTEFYTACAFGTSGQYGFIPRILYYALLMFALFVCCTTRSQWSYCADHYLGTFS